MKIKSILGTIGKDVFPFIATAASGNIPGLVAMAAQKVASVIGVDKIEPTADAIDAAIVQAQTANPDILLKLKEADHDFEIKMAELGFDSVEKMAQIDAGDRANARAREVAVKDVTPKFLAFAVTFGFFGLLWLLAFRAVPDFIQKYSRRHGGVFGHGMDRNYQLLLRIQQRFRRENRNSGHASRSHGHRKGPGIQEGGLVGAGPDTPPHWRGVSGPVAESVDQVV